MDSLRKQEGEVIRNLSDDLNILFFWNVAGEISGEKARIERFLLIISVQNGALQRNGQRHGSIEQIEEGIRAILVICGPDTVLLIGAVGGQRLFRPDKCGSQTGLSHQAFQVQQAAADMAAAVGQMQDAAHVVQRAVHRGGGNAHAVGIACCVRQHTGQHSAFCGIRVEQTERFIASGLGSTLACNHDAVDIAFDQLATSFG